MARYGRPHRNFRATLDPQVQAGVLACWRCRERILPGQAWDLGHDDLDKTITRGPEHRHARDCPAGGNRATQKRGRATASRSGGLGGWRSRRW